jgi:hypothetical protein
VPKGPEEFDNVQPGYRGLTPPAGKLPPRGTRLWIEHPEQLRAATRALEQASLVAIDAEFAQARSHIQGKAGSSVPRLSLLQLAIDQRCFVVDALRLGDLSPLRAVVENPGTTILLHGAGADIRVMAERGLNVMHYYDLEATCRSIFGQHESSLAAMLQRAFNMHLDKSLQRTDWTRRPLPSAMIAYAARDAEVTLALYYWLDQHYHDILQLQEYTGQPLAVSPWIEPFLRGTSQLSPETAVAQAIEKGVIRDKAQVHTDCRAALAMLTYPMYRSRLLRLIADLSLTKLVSDIQPLLQAATSDERAGCARALGRLGAKSSRAAILQLLQDPVQDVRKAALAALHNLEDKKPQTLRPAQSRDADGARRWSTTESNGQGGDDQNGWKSRLRSIMDASS